MSLTKEKQIDFCDAYHLREAWVQVQRKGAQGGIDGVSVDEFSKRSEKYLQDLSRELQEDSYVPEPYQRVVMQQPGSDPRPLGLPTVKDKVVQMAVRNAIEPIFNATFLDCSYAYRLGKGHRKAIGRVEHYLDMGNAWVTTCDIDKFFDCLVHEILLSLVKEKISDARILRLITLWLKIGIVHRDKYREIDKGVPQGGIISPLLSNIYLNPFDRHLANLGMNLVRYADNFIILEKNQEQAEQAHDAAEGFLNTQLKLNLNPIEKKAWNVSSGFVFLGMQFFGKKRTIATKKFNKARMKIQDMCRRGYRKPLNQVVEELNDSIQSWRTYYGEGDTKKQFSALEDHIQVHLGKLVKQKLESEEIKSAAEAGEILNRLNFLLNKKVHKQRKFIKAILKGKAPRVKAEKKYDREIEKKQPRIRLPWRKSAKPAETTESSSYRKFSLAAIKRQIRHKKKKYQRKQASSSELIVATPGCKIGKLHQRIVVRRRGMILQQVPQMQLKYIVVIAEGVSLSSDVIRLCANAKIPIDFIDIQGQPYARLSHPDFPRTQIGLAQMQAFHNGKAKELAAIFVEAKIRNQLNLMKYFHKYRKEVDEEFAKIFSEEEQRIELYITELNALPANMPLEEVRGKLLAIEGRAGSSYWRLVRELVQDKVEFKRREHQGATDLFNCLLNYGYGILYSRIWGGVLRAGLNPMISFLHTDQPGKGTLVFDLIEEFRPQAVDRVIISMIGRGERLKICGSFLDQKTRKHLLKNILERLNIPFQFRDREMSLQQVINFQAGALVQFLQDKKSRYWPFIGKW